MKKKILVTGGDGRFANILKEKNTKLNLYFASKKQCNILNINSITKAINKGISKKKIICSSVEHKCVLECFKV